MRSLQLALIACVPALAAAQGGTDVWVASLTERGPSLTVGTPRNLTARAGYDNQPSFTPDGGAVLFTRIEGSGPSDIWRVPVTGGAPTRVTMSDVESEYSATATPDGVGFTVIRVEPDSTQRLWRFPWGAGDPTVVLPNLKPVGYHVWVSPGMLGAFILGNPNALVLANPLTGRVDTLARSIGRAFARIPGRDAFTYAQMAGDTVFIGEVDVRTSTVKRLMQAPPRGEYHIWTQGGQLIATAGSRLWRWTDGRWDVLLELSALGVRNISRIAISPRGDQIAFVTEDRPSP
jgi:hypothetical protein